MWNEITGQAVYRENSATASLIQTPSYRYIQKLPAHTIFAKVEYTGVAIKRELYLLHTMDKGYHVNMDVFLARHLKKMSHTSTWDILIGGLITLITEHVGQNFNEDDSSFSREQKSLCSQIRDMIMQ